MIDECYFQDEDLQKPAAITLVSQKNESSEEDNELGEETISGENDVEYAEFSLNLRTSPKEQIKNNFVTRNSEIPSNIVNGGVDDFISLPVAISPSNISSESID